ncbi:O-methyltransferase [Flaviaesturariibacter amylovorans]|uniref:Class I SAM-dependent methyltransferase n=1 Tax=Flaviaesturariibacter amylovorans TaxID=1084520 RepID=A0ABP8GMZ4_9BACT
MYSSSRLALKYLHYYRTAYNGKGHGMHSPFGFRFILDVLNNRQQLQPPPAIDALREELRNNRTLLSIEDLGAGSRVQPTKQRTVAQLARAAVKPPKYGQVLYRLAALHQPQTIIELGTSLGITTAYLAAAVPGTTVTTIEGSPAVRAVAQRNFERLGLRNIRSLGGNFDEVLPEVLAGATSVDLAFIDGNHRYVPTMDYFSQLLGKRHNDTVLVFDDIHWSEEMERAWTEIKAHPAVRCSIDLFFLGFVFFRQEFHERQHFTIRY